MAVLQLQTQPMERKPKACRVKIVAVWDNGEKMEADFQNISPDAPAELIEEVRKRRNSTP